MSADLTRRWVRAWAATRALEVGELDGWPLVHVRSASRTAEVVCWEPEPAGWALLLAWVGGDRSRMLSVLAAEPGRYVADLPGDVRVDRDDETLMRRALVASAPARSPDGLRLEVDQDAGRTAVRLVEADRVAAEGTVAVVGPDAAYDGVETTPRYRRRGLGSWVMSALDVHAADAGASTGLLVATADGAALYATLGWERVAPMRSLRGT